MPPGGMRPGGGACAGDDGPAGESCPVGCTGIRTVGGAGSSGGSVDRRAGGCAGWLESELMVGPQVCTAEL